MEMESRQAGYTQPYQAQNTVIFLQEPGSVYTITTLTDRHVDYLIF
jgi:hypothetical protein